MEAIINKPNVVKLMRELRRQLSLDMMNMNFEEQKVFLKKSLKELKRKRKKSL